MKILVEQLSRIAAQPVNDNMRSVAVALNTHGARVGLDLPHRLGQFIPQLAHESGAFKFDRELWGPTPAQKRYDTRTDLGNTPEVDGDGKKNAGRGPLQVTGGYNIGRFEEWCVKMFGRREVPDFTANPDLINTDPWEGLSAIWYWDVGNPEGKSLNRYADAGDTEMITRRINGGLNGYADRLRYVTRVGLVLLGRAPNDVAGFQAWAQEKGYLPADTKDVKQVDGIDGPKTRAAIHQALVALAGQQIAEEEIPTQAAPVVVEQPVAVVPEGSNKRGWLYTGVLTSAAGTVWSSFVAGDVVTRVVIGVTVLAVLGLMLFFGERIIRRARTLIKEVQEN